MIGTIFVLILGTLAAHTIVDFHLQGILAKMKQEAWWEAQIEEMSGDDTAEKKYLKAKYGRDHRAALYVHGLEWSILVTVPAMVLLGGCPTELFLLVLANACTHVLIDDAKCNLLSINLWQDQLLHLGQLALIWLFYWSVGGTI